MKPITIKEMTLGTTYTNRYIIFEIITEIKLMISIMFLGKDNNVDLVLISKFIFDSSIFHIFEKIL